MIPFGRASQPGWQADDEAFQGRRHPDLAGQAAIGLYMVGTIEQQALILALLTNSLLPLRIDVALAAAAAAATTAIAEDAGHQVVLCALHNGFAVFGLRDVLGTVVLDKNHCIHEFMSCTQKQVHRFVGPRFV